MAALNSSSVVDALLLSSSNSLVRVAVPFDVTYTTTSTDIIGPLRRTNGFDSEGVKLVAEFSIADWNEGDDSVKATQLLKEQVNVLNTFAHTWGERCMPWSPIDDNHGQRLKVYLTDSTVIIDDDLTVASIEDVSLLSREVVFTCRLHKINFEWEGKCQSESALEVVRLFVLIPPEFDGFGDEDPRESEIILRLINEV
ncbi:hypothetical protein PQX77_013485 [Marasmius sp. AFHP31]|nr:hypothetical protein PQX77_013485 [Marasmius sp. AFHP31]